MKLFSKYHFVSGNFNLNFLGLKSLILSFNRYYHVDKKNMLKKLKTDGNYDTLD